MVELCRSLVHYFEHLSLGVRLLPPLPPLSKSHIHLPLFLSKIFVSPSLSYAEIQMTSKTRHHVLRGDKQHIFPANHLGMAGNIPWKSSRDDLPIERTLIQEFLDCKYKTLLSHSRKNRFDRAPPPPPRGINRITQTSQDPRVRSAQLT